MSIFMEIYVSTNTMFSIQATSVPKIYTIVYRGNQTQDDVPKLKYFLCTVSYAVHSIFLNRPCSCLCSMSWSWGSFGLLKKKKLLNILFTFLTVNILCIAIRFSSEKQFDIYRLEIDEIFHRTFITVLWCQYTRILIRISPTPQRPIKVCLFRTVPGHKFENK